MLDINWSDVVNVITSIAPYLIAIGIVLVVAIAVTVAVNKRTVKAVAVRKLAHSETWLMALVASVVAIMLMLYGPLYGLLNNATLERRMLQESTIQKADELGPDIQREAITLLQNHDGICPWMGRSLTCSDGLRRTRCTEVPVPARCRIRIRPCRCWTACARRDSGLITN